MQTLLSYNSRSIELESCFSLQLGFPNRKFLLEDTECMYLLNQIETSLGYVDQVFDSTYSLNHTERTDEIIEIYAVVYPKLRQKSPLNVQNYKTIREYIQYLQTLSDEKYATEPQAFEFLKKFQNDIIRKRILKKIGAYLNY